MISSNNTCEMDNRTINSTVKNRICVGCGTCISLCPKEAIKIVLHSDKGIYLPELDEDLCINCGICLKVCPGIEIDFDGLNREIFGSVNGDLILGNYVNCYIGNAADQKVRFDASSGGLITAILVSALEGGIIDGALVTRMKKDRPLEPEPFIARTKKEIIESSKSKYCPVPSNVALKEILNADKDDRFAIVGIPCQINGIRKAEKLSKELKNKIVLHCGIMCSHNDTFLATEFILKYFNFQAENIERLEYRGNGWPGSMSIKFRNGEEKTIPFKKSISAHGLWMFNPRYCAFCCDSICQLSDISFGDAWNIKNVKGDKIGTSLCITRTLSGDKMLQKFAADNLIKVDKLSKDQIIGTQGIFSKSRIRYSKLNMSKCKLLGEKFTKYNKINLNENAFSPTLSDYAKFILFNTNRKIMSIRSIWSASKAIINIEENSIKLGKSIK